MKPIPYGKQHITKEDVDAIVTTITSEFLTQGPKIAEFEKAFAEYIGSQFAVAVSNGTAALHLCALALNVREGTNVITTPITFVASANCVKYCGGNVHFADINPDTFLIDELKLQKLIASKPKGYFNGIIPVNFAGLANNLEILKKIASENNLWIIEDSCHSPGGFFEDSQGINQNCGNGNYADLAIFSFHPVKHIATGEGGMITTNDEELFKKLCILRTHGITKDIDVMTENHGGWYYQMMELGYNYRMPDMLCALGISQLKRANDGLAKRRSIAAKYNQAFQNNKQLNIQDPSLQKGHAFHLYIIKAKNRTELYNYLRTKNIFTQVHYIPVHTMPFYRTQGYKDGDFPVSEEFYSQCLSLPMFPSLSDEEQDYVIKTIIEFYN